MRLAVVSSSYPRHRDDASGCFVQTSVKALVNTGAQVSVHVPDDLQTVPRVGVHPVRYAPLRRWQNLCYGHGILPNLQRSPWTGLWIPALMTALTRRIRRLRHLPLIAHWHLPTALAARLARHPCVVAMAHGSDVAVLERLPGGPILARQIADSVAHLCFASPDLRRRFERVCGRSLPDASWLPAAVQIHPSPAQDQARRQLNLETHGPIALFLGRLLASKGVDLVLELAGRLAGKVKVVIAGDGPLRLRVEHAAHANPSLRYLGPVPPRRQPQLFAAADLLLAPSQPDAHGHSEGLPVVILEALAAGLPILSSPVGGISDLLKHRHDALLSRPGDIESLHQSTLRLIQNPSLARRLAHAGHSTVQPFLAPSHATRLRDIIERVQQQRSM